MTLDTKSLITMLNDVIEGSPSVLGLKTDMAILKEDVAILKEDVAILKEDVAILKEDVAILKEDVAMLKVDVANIKEDMSQFREQLFGLTATVEDMQRDLKLILDAVLPAKMRATQVDQMFQKVDNHEYRLGAVETWIKDHNA